MSNKHAEKIVAVLRELNYEMEQRASELAMDVRALGFEGVTVPPSVQGNTAVLLRQQGMIVALTEAVNSLGLSVAELLIEQGEAQLKTVDDVQGRPAGGA